METNELKFLLILLGSPDYRSPLAAKAFDSIKAKDQLVQDLANRSLIDFSWEIATVKILPPGEELLNLDKEESTLTPREFKILENISKAAEKVAPSKISPKSLKSADRDAILASFQDRGLIEVETKIKRQKAEVWLTQQGQDYLRNDFIPQGGNQPVISLDLLTGYLNFLRQSLQVISG